MASGVNFYSDEYKRAADLYTPPGHSKEVARAAIVLCHGYTGTRRIHLPDYAMRFTEAGYVVLTFDYRGWGDSEGPRNRLAPHDSVADTQAALSVIAMHPYVDAARLALFGTRYGASIALWAAAIDKRVRGVVASIGVGNGARWMCSVGRPDEYVDLMRRAPADRTERALNGRSTLVARDEILLPDRESLALGNAARAHNPAAVTELPLSFVDDTLGFNPEWIIDKIAPRPVLFVTSDDDRLVPPEESEAMYARARQPKRLVVIKSFSHYACCSGEALRRITDAALDWYGEHMPMRESVPKQ